MAYKLVSHLVGKKRFFVYKINDISFHERLFCIFDKEYPFELNISYKEMSKKLELAPNIGGKGGFQLQESTSLETNYRFRFETEDECQKHIDEVKKKKQLIDEMLINFTDDMMCEYNKKMIKKIENFNSLQMKINENLRKY